MAGHRSDVERAEWVARFRASGVGCERFARQHGLAPSTLYNWVQRFDGADDDDDDDGHDHGGVGFAEVRVVGGAVGSGLTLELPNGCVIRVSGDVDEAQLQAVVRAAAAC